MRPKFNSKQWLPCVCMEKTKQNWVNNALTMSTDTQTKYTTNEKKTSKNDIFLVEVAIWKKSIEEKNTTNENMKRKNEQNDKHFVELTIAVTRSIIRTTKYLYHRSIQIHTHKKLNSAFSHFTNFIVVCVGFGSLRSTQTHFHNHTNISAQFTMLIERWRFSLC